MTPGPTLQVIRIHSRFAVHAEYVSMMLSIALPYMAAVSNANLSKSDVSISGVGPLLQTFFGLKIAQRNGKMMRSAVGRCIFNFCSPRIFQAGFTQNSL